MLENQFINILRPYRITGGYTEVNGPGLPVFEMLRKEIRRLKDWTTNNSNKAEGIRNLIYDIQEGGLELPSKEFFPHIYNELNAYSYYYFEVTRNFFNQSLSIIATIEDFGRIWILASMETTR